MGLFGSILPSVVGGALGLLGSKSSAKSAARAAEASNQFTERMMQNRHQWEVSDLKAAGLNPMLSAGGTPSMGSSAKAEVFNPVDSAVSGVHSAVAARQLSANLQNVKADTDLKKAQQVAALSSAKAALQTVDIKKPLGDAARAVGDLSGSFLDLWRDFQRDPLHTQFPNPLKFFKRGAP